MSKYVIAFALILIPGFLSAQTDYQERAFEKIMSTLAHPELLRAKFNQSKKLDVLKKPLISSGEMIHVSGRGVAWIIEKPYQIKLHVTPTGIVKNISEQSSLQQPNRFTQTITRIFLSTLAGDLAMLTENFNIREINHPAESNFQWSLQLSPKGGPLTRIIDALNLEGREFINKIEIVEAGGDVTVINFHQQTSQPGTLNEEEMAYFLD